MIDAYGSNLLLALAGAPSLPGARCRNRSTLFDEPERDENKTVASERQAQALGLCAACPALEKCGEWFLSLRPSDRPRGVVAGRVNQPVAGRSKVAS